MSLDGRHKWLAGKIASAYGFKDATIPEKLLSDHAVSKQVYDFCSPTGPVKLMFFYQVPEKENADGEFVPIGEKPVLFLTNGDNEKLRGKAVYFIRINNKGIAEKTIEQDVTFGEVLGSALESFRVLMTDVFYPVLKEQESWGVNPEEATAEFLASTTKFGATLREAANSLQGGVELRHPDKKWVDADVELKVQTFNKLAADEDALAHFESVLEGWCVQVERLLDSEQDNSRKESEDAGPDTELEFWRNRMAKFNSITEQLKSKEARLVLGVCNTGRTKCSRLWKVIDMKVTDAANEAKDNVKYLTTLEKSLEPMYHGTPQAIIDSLPALMNNIKMMHTIARYYNTPERMTTLFCKVTNQMITNCKAYIMGNTKLWDQDKPELLAKLEMAQKLNEAYQECYKQTRDRLQSQPKGKQFQFKEQKIFSKFDLFCKRVGKLIDMFNTVHQFSVLSQHTHIEGLDEMIKNFFSIVDDFKRKPYDLMDYTKNQFDRDFLEFNVNIHELETALQGFINASFENITSTEHALHLLRQFQAILSRDSLKADLEDKYMVIFQNYGLDLDAVQRIYEKYKHAPSLVRNAPPVAGCIMWARQLLRRIEEPMKKFSANRSIMATKESKRIVKTYNKVAKALIEFETLWHQAWVKSIDSAKAGLQATLIVRHPENGRLLVNFDKEILQLMRETKNLQRLGIEVPESAKMVLLQEEKFKSYYNQLSYALREYDRVMASILVVAKPLLGPHLDDLDKKIQPGMFILTWTSMNIDGYLHRIHNGLARLEELIRKINDMVENRVEANLKAISKTLLVDLPPDKSFTFEDFVTTQGRFIKKQTELMDVRNMEVERAVLDLIDLVSSYPRENSEMQISPDLIAKFKKHYSRLMYQAILSATKKSFNAMKRRLGSRTSGGFLFVDRPFFDVDVELSIPNVSMNPSLEDIQGAINTTAKRVLRCSSDLVAWGFGEVDGKPLTFYDMIASDKEIVKSVLLLTGSIEGTKQHVMDYISTFSKYDFLWKHDMQGEYAEFMRTNPTLDAFEAELRKYMDIEQEIGLIPPVHNIGAMSLETQPMKYSLKAEAASWKAQFAKNLHRQGHEDLKRLNNYMRETTMKLSRQIEDLEDVRVVMNVLREVREKEAEIDTIMMPIEEMYALLLRYEVRVPKEEIDQVGDLRYSWKKLRKLANDVSDNLARLQVGFKRELIKEVKSFVVDVSSFRQDFDSNGPMVPGLAPMDAVDRLKKFQSQFEVRKRKWDNYTSGEELFGLPITKYPELEKTEKELALLDKLYSLYVLVITTINGYADIYWVEVVSNIDTMTEQVNNFQQQCRKLPKALRDWEAFHVCKKTIDDFLEILPLLQQLSNKALRNRHWQQLMTITGKQIVLAEDVMKLQHLLEADLLAHAEDIEELCNAAVKEEMVEVKLAQIGDDWADLSLTFNNYKQRGLVILKGAETSEIVEKLEDTQMALGSMATNRYSGPFREEVNGWITKLSTVSEILEMWLTVQNMWMYMEAVFSGGDIAKQLPQEAKRFQNIDKNYMKIVTNAIEVKNVVQTCYGNELMKNLLPHLTEQLELCQKSLSAYLETKRAEFPRFYFVSDPTLLEILSLGSDPQAVQPHFQSGLFDSIAQVTFDRVDKTKIIEMISVQGEKVELYNPVVATGNIEDWLKKLVAGMQNTMKEVIRRAYLDVNELTTEEFVFHHPAQVSLLGIQFQWTADAQTALATSKADKSVMSKAMKKQDALLRDLVALTMRELSSNERTNLETIVTVHVHQRDTFEELLKKKIRDASDFEWLKQCRFYWREDRNTVIISIADVDFEYSYEYLGVKERLVITPLTDRCYVTLSQALGMFLGGAPAGPAGTGKTETTKDLGATLGKFVVVFNCSDQMDYKGMGKIYKGLAQSGLWGCFDEFNRINLDVLSVCAQQCPDKSETFLMMRTLRDMNLSKFVAEDVPLFLSLIDDLFPGIKADKAVFPDVEAALLRQVAERGLQAHPSWMVKCVQLYETYLVRHGIMLVGPTGGGKTTICECLAGALSEVFTKHVLWRMNPKAITAPQMFGRLDPTTGDWTDGVFAVLWRKAAKNKNQNTWIVLDGPVDAIWIENLNTVLDDNKVLTLANGDRIPMIPNMKAMFEPENLANASPATVSRAGIIYVSESELGWQPVVDSWLAKRKAAENAVLSPLFAKYIGEMLGYVRLQCKVAMKNQDVCSVNTLLWLLESLFSAPHLANEAPAADHVERLFLYAVTWSVGGLVMLEDRQKFDARLRELGGESLPAVDEGETIFEYLVSDANSMWEHWKENVPEWHYPTGVEKPKFASMVIPTMDSVRLEALLSLVQRGNHAALLVGGPGTAKTATIKQYVGRFNPEEQTSKTITFSSLTTPRIFQQGVEACVEKRQGRTFGPPGGKQMTIFIDDMSMPYINEWGDQVTNEILRQLLDQGGFYNLEKPGDMKHIIDVKYMGAMNQPGGGKNDIPNRLKRQFAIFNVPLPSTAAINNIFGSLVTGRFDSATFGEGVVEVASQLVATTVTLWGKVSARMLPTPAKFHYLFNMRDLSRVFQGIILATRDRFSTACMQREGYAFDCGNVSTPDGYLLALWKHECTRVFADKLTTPQDKAWVEKTLQALVRDTYGEDLMHQTEEPAYFVDFLRDPVYDDDGVEIDAHPSYYEAIRDLGELRNKVDGLQGRFNEENKLIKLELVLFEDALMHMMRVSRILCMDRGSALLVGVGGSGKQSLTRLAAYIAGAYPFQLTVTKQYSVTNLLEDIKGMYKVAGFKGQPVAFIFTDAEVKDEAFLEYINQMLMTGEVSGLFPKDEIDMIVNDIRPVMKQVKPSEIDTYDNLHRFFLDRVRDNLHVILCFSPVGDKFSRRSQQFPGLINGCTIDWFLPWPLEALKAVARRFVDAFEMAADKEVKSSLIDHMATVHNSVVSSSVEYFERYRRHVYVTPKSYLSFINGYKALYGLKFVEVKELASKIDNGLAKLFEAKSDVAKMKVELGEKNIELAEAQKVSEVLLKEISASTAIAEKEKAKVSVVQTAAKKMADEIGEMKDNAERDLAAAKPALDAAIEALSSITAKDIQTLKQLKNPPDIVKRIFDAVMMLRQLPLNKVSYEDVKGSMTISASYSMALPMMGDMNFLPTLLKFPKEQINDETCELLQPYFSAPDFNFDSAKKASGNVAGLASWCMAMVTYHQVAKFVEPKIVALHEAEAQLKIASKQLAEAEEKMAVVQAKLDKMQAEFDGAMKEKQRLEDDAERTQRRMDAANALISALSGEEHRWTEQSREFAATIDRLTGDCALASSFLSYCGPFNREFRDMLVKKQFLQDCVDKSIPVTRSLEVTKFLVEEAEVGEWTLQGLPSDELSIQNGLLVTRATRWPLLIDPQGQGLAWIKQKEVDAGIKVTNFGDRMFRNTLEDCLAFGRPLLIENIEEEVDPVLDPILEKRFVKSGKGLKVVLADKEVDYSNTFKLFMTTRLPNPHYTPELSAKVTIIDFTVTMQGLEDQLLGQLILKEKHELEEQRQKLLEEVNSYKKKIKQLEDDLLLRLSSSTGNLLDDTELIDVLAVTKQTAQDVNEKLINANETNKKITEACEEYRGVAHRATLIYFLIAEFSSVNVMYQTSLRQFNALYDLSIENSERAAMPSKRIAKIIEYMTYLMYCYIQRGLFESHKLTFALMLAIKILVSDKTLSEKEVGVFLKGGAMLDISSVRKKPKDWIPDPVWLNVIALTSLPMFHDLGESVFRNDALWRQWYDQEAPEYTRVPDFEDRLRKFDKMVLVRAFREDRTLIAASDYIADTLGRRFVDSIPLNMEATWQESNSRMPLICLLSPGSDPTKQIEDLAKKKKIKVLGVSMGQGQEIIARKYMATAVQEGNWVLLQNTHLGLNYLSEVEAFLLKAEDIHDSFRLWITAEPHPKFPIGLLQMSIKITNEAPVGIKAGLKGAYAWLTQDVLDAVPRHEWYQLLFVMCFVHSITQERRKFGPIGWNVPYEFNQSDLSACVQFLQNHLNEMDTKKSSQVTWSTVRYMVAEIQYGGRITDDFDRVLMMTYADQYFHQGVMEKNYELFPQYVIPLSSEISFFRQKIEEVPSTDNPEVFGLHSNADLTFRALQVQSVLTTIIDTQPKTSGGAKGMSRDEVVDRICEDLLGKIPAAFKIEEAKERLRKIQGGPTAPLNVHLKQEIDRINIIIGITATSLKNLRLAIAGTIALSGALIDAHDALYNARIPKQWLAKSWDASTLGIWFGGMIQRFDQLHKWLNGGKPKAYWLTGFFNPQGFLTAMKQEVNRKHAAEKWALDDVVMHSEVTYPAKEIENLREGPSEGVYVYGLFLDGCGWNPKDNRLVDPEPKKLFYPLPIVYVTGVLASNQRKEQQYTCPVYRIKKRTGQHFVTTFNLRTEDPPSKWVMRGAAIMCSVD
eukprot:jgi/Mesvir1/18818/Mv04309-RA.2